MILNLILNLLLIPPNPVRILNQIIVIKTLELLSIVLLNPRPVNPISIPQRQRHLVVNYRTTQLNQKPAVRRGWWTVGQWIKVGKLPMVPSLLKLLSFWRNQKQSPTNKERKHTIKIKKNIFYSPLYTSLLTVGHIFFSSSPILI